MDNIISDLELLQSQAMKIGNLFFSLDDKSALSSIDKFSFNLNNAYIKLASSEYINILPENALNNLNAIFNNIILGIQNKDYILLGDLFVYELSPLVKNIISNLNQSFLS